MISELVDGEVGRQDSKRATDRGCDRTGRSLFEAVGLFFGIDRRPQKRNAIDEALCAVGRYDGALCDVTANHSTGQHNRTTADMARPDDAYTRPNSRTRLNDDFADPPVFVSIAHCHIGPEHNLVCDPDRGIRKQVRPDVNDRTVADRDCAPRGGGETNGCTQGSNRRVATNLDPAFVVHQRSSQGTGPLADTVTTAQINRTKQLRWIEPGGPCRGQAVIRFVRHARRGRRFYRDPISGSRQDTRSVCLAPSG